MVPMHTVYLLYYLHFVHTSAALPSASMLTQVRVRVRGDGLPRGCPVAAQETIILPIYHPLSGGTSKVAVFIQKSPK